MVSRELCCSGIVFLQKKHKNTNKMKKIFLLGIIFLAVFFTNCRKDDSAPSSSDPISTGIVYTDDPPQALKGSGSQWENPTTIYISSADIEKSEYLCKISRSGWDQNGNYTIVYEDRFRISGCIQWGFYNTSLYLSKSITAYSISAEVLEAGKKIAKLRGYFLGDRSVEYDFSTGLGLQITRAY
jgi:hypothetical protein